MYKLSGFPYEPTNEWFAADQNNLLSGMYNILYDVDMAPVSGSEASIDTTNDIHQLSVAIATEASRGTFYKCTEDGLNNSYTLSVSPSGNHALQTKPKNGNRYSFIVPSENSGPTVMNIPFHVSTGGGGEHMMSNIDIIQSNGLPLVGGEFIEGMFIQLLFHYSDGSVPQLKIISSGTGGAGEITKNISQSNNFKLNQALYIDKTGKYQVANAGSPDGTLSGAGFKSGVVGIVSKEGIQSFELTMMGSMSVNDGFVKGSDYWLNPNTSLTPTDPNIVPIEPIWDEFPYSVRVYIGTALSKDELLVNVDVGSELYEELTYTMAKEGIAFWNKNLGYRINYRCIDTLDNNEYYATVSINPGGDTPSKNKDWKEVYSDKNIIKVNQTNHGFVKWDAVKVINKGYDKALADDPENADTYGIVSKVKDKDNFVLTLNGFIEDPDSDLPEDSDFYLSNKIAGEISPGEYLIIEFGEIIQYIGTTVSIDTADGNVKGLNVQISEGIQPIEFPDCVFAINGLYGKVGMISGTNIDITNVGNNIQISVKATYLEKLHNRIDKLEKMLGVKYYEG